MASLLLQLDRHPARPRGRCSPYLLSTQFNAWQGLLRQPVDWAPIVRAAWVCALYAAAVAVRRATWCSCAATSPAADARWPSGSWSSTTTRRCGACSQRSSRPRASRSQVAADGGAALAAAERSAPDLVVLDVAMPGLDGLAVCRRLRAKGCAGAILMLTARDAVADRVAGLEAGADDYLVKPFAIEELVARMRALTRRGARRRRRASPSPTSRSTSGRAWPQRGGRARSSSRGRESALLELMLRHPRAVVPRERALEEIWEEAAAPNVVDRYVTRLRRKLGEPPLIHTVRGVGVHAADMTPRTLTGRLTGGRDPRGRRRGRRAWRCPRSCSSPISCAPRSTRACASRAVDVARLSVSAPALLTAPGALEAPVGGRQLSVEVLDRRGRFVARSLTLGAKLLPASAVERPRPCGRARSGFADVALGGEPLRLFAAPLARGRRAGRGRRRCSSRPARTTSRPRCTAWPGCCCSAARWPPRSAARARRFLTRRGLRPLAAPVDGGEGDRAHRRPGAPAARPRAARTRSRELARDAQRHALRARRRARGASGASSPTPATSSARPLTSLAGNVDFVARHGAQPRGARRPAPRHRAAAAAGRRPARARARRPRRRRPASPCGWTRSSRARPPSTRPSASGRSPR